MAFPEGKDLWSQKKVQEKFAPPSLVTPQPVGPWAQHQPGAALGEEPLTPQGNESPAGCSLDSNAGRWSLSLPSPESLLELENHRAAMGAC